MGDMPDIFQFVRTYPLPTRKIKYGTKTNTPAQTVQRRVGNFRFVKKSDYIFLAVCHILQLPGIEMVINVVVGCCGEARRYMLCSIVCACV